MRRPLLTAGLALAAAAYLAGLIVTGSAVFRLGLDGQPGPRGALARTADYGLPPAPAGLPPPPSPAAVPSGAAATAAAAPAAMAAVRGAVAEAEGAVGAVTGSVPSACQGLAAGRLQSCLHGKLPPAPVGPPGH